MPKPNGADPNPNPSNDDPGFASVSADPVTDPAEPGAGDPPPSAGQDDPAPGNSDADEITVPEAFRTEDGALDTEKALAHLTESETARAARIEKFGDVPEGDANYDLSDLKDAEGNEIGVDLDNPFVKMALPQLKEAGVGGKLVRDLVGGYAQVLTEQVGEVVTAIRAEQSDKVKAEIGKLGDEGPNRIKGLIKGLSSVPSDAGDDTKALFTEEEAGVLVNSVRTAQQFELLERLWESAGGTEGGSRLPGGQREEAPQDIIFGKRN